MLNLTSGLCTNPKGGLRFMIKIFSLIFFICALSLSWCLMNQPSQMGIDVHAGIQSKLALVIEESIKAQRPSSDHFQMLKMYTQKIDDLKIKAHFSYQFEDILKEESTEATTILDPEKTLQKISGEATLVKTITDDPTIQKWTVQSIKTGSESIDFKEGLTLTQDSGEVPTENTQSNEATAPETK